MRRRDAMSAISVLLSRSLISAPLFLNGCRPEESTTLVYFTKRELELLDQIAETILPTTPGSPGAKAAGVGAFIDRYVADCLSEEDQQVVQHGLTTFEETCKEQFGTPFLELKADEQHDYLVKLDIEAEMHQQMTANGTPPYFTLLKGMTLLGYFTSEAGATQALRYIPVPGKYEGSVPYQDGEKAWAI